MVLSLKKVFSDRSFVVSFLFAILVSSLAFYLFFNLLVKNSSFWLAPMFIPIYIFIVLVFLLNFLMALLIENKQKLLALGLNCITIGISFLLLVAYIFNLTNPNG